MTPNSKCSVAIAASLAVSLLIGAIKVAHADQPRLSFHDVLANRPTTTSPLNHR